LAGGFDKIFTNQGWVTPRFARPEISSRLPALPTSPDESGPATTASVDPPENPQPQSGLEDADRKGVASVLKQLVISPAEAGPSPGPPESDPAQPSEPHDATAALGRPATQPLRESRFDPTVSRLRAIRPRRDIRFGLTVSRKREMRSAGLNRASPRTVRAGRPTIFSPLGGGRAVWYQHPGRTASGERFNPNGLTAAHRSLPLGTRVRVVNKTNGRSVVVRINDRMPAKLNYAIDLSRGSARALGIEGVGSVALYRAK